MRLEHESNGGDSANQAESGLEAGSSTGALGKRRAGGRGNTSAAGAGDEAAGDGHALAGHDDGGVTSGVASAGDDDGGLADGDNWGGAVGLGGWEGSAGGLGAGRWGGNWVAAVVVGRGRAGGSDVTVALGALRDTELGGVLVEAGDVVNELDSVAGSIGLEVGGHVPGVGTAVGNADDDVLERNNVVGGATEQDQGHAVRAGWRPGDGEGLACRDLLWGVSVVFCFTALRA